MNYENYCRVLERIEADPEQHDQDRWCGTKCCLAGHAAMMQLGKSGNDLMFLGEQGVYSAAADFLGLSRDESRWFWHYLRTLDDFRRVRLVAGYAKFSQH